MCQYFVIKRIQQECPFPLDPFMLKDRHVRHNNLQRLLCVPAAFDLVGELYIFFARFLIFVLSCFRTNSCSTIIEVLGAVKNSLCKKVVSPEVEKTPQNVSFQKLSAVFLFAKRRIF